MVAPAYAGLLRNALAGAPPRWQVPVATLPEKDRLEDPAMGLAITGGNGGSPVFAQARAEVSNAQAGSFAQRNRIKQRQPTRMSICPDIRAKQKGLPDIQFHPAKYLPRVLT